MNANPTLLLWDIDGTLMLSAGSGVRAMKHVGARLFGDDFTFDHIEFAGHLDPLIFAEAAARHGLDYNTHHQRFHDQYLDELRAELARNVALVRCPPGVKAALQLMRDRAATRGDVVQGLLTGNYTRAVPIKLESLGFDPGWFEINAFGDEGKTRPDLVAVAMRKYTERFKTPPDPRRVIIIGDTPRDITCAHAHGCLCVAVATGNYRLDQLRAAGADVAVADLSDPTPLVELLG